MTMDALRASLADRYTLERELGVGGMATVYLAEDIKHKRTVAFTMRRPSWHRHGRPCFPLQEHT
jgi:serine/threonine-protein kinase